jgi:hypothetical protein
MMKAKFNWLFGIIIMLGFLCTTGAVAQSLDPTSVERDKNGQTFFHKLKRAEWLALAPPAQKSFLLDPQNTIIDLINFRDGMDPANDPGHFYITVADFYSYDVDRKEAILFNPDTYIVMP